MQPDWRGKSFPQEVPSDANWAPLLCGGANGILLIVLALAWWIQASDGSGKTNDQITAAVNDVTWVLGHLKGAFANGKSNGRKRKNESAMGKHPSAKRYA